MDISQIVFLIVGAVMLVSALGVVVLRNLIHAALLLIVTLFSVAILFVMLDAGFMAAVQVVLYIGAIAILIIFAVMLTRRVMADESEKFNSQWFVGMAVAVFGFAGLALVFGLLNQQTSAATVSPETLNLSIAKLGEALVSPSGFVIPFQIASILLTVALVGAIAVAGEKK
jgi:NADH-quinone oxidoreductase subunit J